MTTLQLMIDGAVAAAELLALLFVSPAHAGEPAAVDTAAALERPIQVHRLSTSVDVRLLGTLAGVRVAHTVHNPSSAIADVAPSLPRIDDGVDALRVVRDGMAVDLVGDAADQGPAGGHVRLSVDERIADALQLGPGATALIEAVTTQPLERDRPFARVRLPVRLDDEIPRAILLEADDGPFLVLVPGRTAARATLVLRPLSGDGATLQLGAVDTRQAVLVPLAGRGPLAQLAAGAIELELDDGTTSWWSTLAPQRGTAHAAVQARHAD